MSSLLEDLVRIKLRDSGQNVLEDTDLAIKQDLAAIRNREALNEAREKATREQIVSNSDYNPVTQALTALSLSTMQSALDTIISKPQAILANIGSPYGDSDEEKEYYRSMFATTGMPEEHIEREFNADPNNWANRAAQGLTKWRGDADNYIKDTKRQIIGDNPGLGIGAFDTAGTTFGSFIGDAPLAALAYSGAPTKALFGLILGALRGASESITEGTGILTDNYMANPTPENWTNSVQGMDYNIMHNALTDIPLGMAEDWFTFGQDGGYLKRLAGGLGANLFIEPIQETKQDALNEAADRTIKGGDVNPTKYWENVSEEFQPEKILERYKQTAPTIAGSTLITAPVFALFGGGGDQHRNTNMAINPNAEGKERLQNEWLGLQEELRNTPEDDEVKQAEIISRIDKIENSIKNFNQEEFDKLTADRASLQEQIANSTNPDEQSQLIIRLENINNAIENFGKDAEQIKTEGQAEAAAEAVNTTPAPEVTPFVEPEVLPDSLLNPLQEEYGRIQQLIDEKILTQNNENIQNNQDELAGLFARQRRIDSAIKNGDISEANKILEEQENLQKTGVAFDIYTADLQQLEEERDRLQALYEKKLNEQFTPQLQEELYSLNSSINAIESAIQDRDTQSENTNNTPSMDDLWSMVESNEDANEYSNDDYDEDTAVSQNIKQGQLEEDLRFDIKDKLIDTGLSEEEAEALSQFYIAGNKYLAKYTGNSLEDIIAADNLRFENHDILPIQDKSGNIVGEAKAQTDFTEFETLIKVSKQADQSSILHEMGHLFLRKLQNLARSGMLKGLAKHDWNTLLKSYGLSEIDFNNMSKEDIRAWHDTHEKFATDLERYFMTGEAPSAKLKHIFEQFKKWLTEIYHAIENITYADSDGQQRPFTLSPEIKQVFDHMLGENEELGARSEAKTYNQNVNTNDSESYNQTLTGEEKEDIQDKLESAQEMVDMKVPPRLIKKATGWEKISEDEWHWEGKNSAGQDAKAAYFPRGNEHRKSKDALSQALLTYNNKGLKAIFEAPSGTKIHQIHHGWDMTEHDFEIGMRGQSQKRLIRIEDGKHKGSWALSKENIKSRFSLSDVFLYYPIPKTAEETAQEEAELFKTLGIKPKTYNQVAKDNIELRTENGHTIEEADISEKLLTPDGSKNFGIIDKETAQIAGISEGNIQIDVEGLLHTKLNKHNKEIINAGYPSVESFFIDVLGNYNKIYQGNDDSLLLVKTLKKHNGAAAIELAPDEKGTYIVQTGWIIRDRGLKGKKLLFSRSEPTDISPVTDEALQTASNKTGETDSNALLKSNNGSLRSILDNVNDNDRQTQEHQGRKTETYYQSLGEQGARELDKQEGTTYRMDNLKVAKEMTEAGKDAKTIRIATGWEKGQDGKWRWEIMDGKLNVHKLYKAFHVDPEKPSASVERTLEEIFSNDELYKAYPQLKEISVFFLDLGKDYGMHDPKNHNIWINTSLNPERAQSTLIHEIQHAIQDIEGFARGGNQEMFEDNVISLEKLKHRLEWFKDRYKHALEESEKSDLESVIKKLEARISEVEENALEGMVEVEEGLYDDTLDAYRHLAGEAEARNAQTREKFTAEQRRKTTLAETLDTDKPLIERYYQAMRVKRDLNETYDFFDFSPHERQNWIKENLDDKFPEIAPLLRAGLSFDEENVSPHYLRTQSDRKQRAQKQAEVVTPLKLVKMMVDNLVKESPEIVNSWQALAKSTVLEPACGETPFITTRYDIETGDIIPLNKRVGFLDRKFAEIDKAVNNEKDWLKWAFEAVNSVWGFDADGGSVLIARTNIVNTFADHLQEKWNRTPTRKELKWLATITQHNYFQDDYKIAFEKLKRADRLPLPKELNDNETYNQAIMANDERVNSQEQIDAVRKQYEGTDKWLKAPNGKKSNLSEKQWLQVRTPNFKRWFGNWNYNGNEQVKVTDITGLNLEVDFKDTKALKKWLVSEYAGKSIQIETDGSIVGFSSKKLNDSLKRRGEAQRSAYTALEDLIKNAVYYDFERNDGQDKHKNLAGQDIYYSAMRIGDNFYSVKFKFDTLKEDLSRTYKDHKVTEITISPLVYHTQTRAINSATYARTGDKLAFTLADLTDSVKPKNVSKVVDENGEPLVVYHGTDYGGFSVFNTGEKGAFFSSEDRASWYHHDYESKIINYPPEFKSWEEIEDYLYGMDNDGNQIGEDTGLRIKENSDSELDESHVIYSRRDKNITERYVDNLEEARAAIHEMKTESGNAGNIYACYLDIKNPKIIDAKGEWAGNIDQIRDNGEQDGVIVHNVVDGSYDSGNFEDTNYIVFSPEQIKSATDNRGTFDGNNPEIYYQVAFRPRQAINEWFKKGIDWLHGKDIEERSLVSSAEPAKPANKGYYSFENEESERRYIEAKHGAQQVGVLQRVKNGTTQLLKSMKGDFPELAGDKRFLKAREALRMLGRKRSAQVHKAMKTFTENLKNLNTRQLDLFGRMRLLDDLMERKRQVKNADLPFGFTDEMLKKEHAKFSKIVKSEPAVQKAIAAEEATMKEISSEFVSLTGQLGLHLEEKFKNPHYFRHSILEYASTAAAGIRSFEDTSIQADDSLQGIVDKELNNIRNRSWLKRYKGSKLDINSDYVMAMGEVRSQMLMDIETMKTLIEIKKEYDIAPRLRESIRQAFRQAQNGAESHSQAEGVNLSDIIPEGYEIYNPAGSRLIQSANTPVENVLAMAIDDASENSGIPVDEIMATAGMNNNEFFNQLWVIPKELKETLKKMSKGRDRGILGNTAKVLTTWWKKAVLYSPTRNLRYNLRNFTGDLDAVIAGNPGILTPKFAGRAFKELISHFRGKETTQDLKDFLERIGGELKVESINFSDQQLKLFDEVMEENKENPSSSLTRKSWGLIKKFFAKEVQITQLRENWLRYAAYLAYKEDMEQNNGVPTSWGASNKDEVMTHSNIKDKAYKMSNDLLGNYDEISEVGKQLRDMLIPFWSWQEVNLKRYYRLIRNGVKGDNAGEFTKRLLIGQTTKIPYYAVAGASTFAKISLLTMMIQAFNRFVFPDDDDELPNDVKYRPHITLGKVDGKVYYFDRIGALADAADWLSLDSIVLDAKELANGQQSLGGYMKKMAQAPVSKVIGQLNPMLKMPIELATGRSLYPDAFHSRTIKDNGQYLAQTVGLEWPYKAIAGKSRSDADELTKLLLYSVDPDEAAYYQTLDKVRQFQERVLDKHFNGFATTKRGQVLRDLKTAMRYKDKAAVRRYLREYAKLDGTPQGLKTSLKAMNPLNGLSKDEKKKFLKWISADDKKFLRRAMKYYQDLIKNF